MSSLILCLEQASSNLYNPVRRLKSASLANDSKQGQVSKNDYDVEAKSPAIYKRIEESTPEALFETLTDLLQVDTLIS